MSKEWGCWDYLPLVDFGLMLLRNIPSKELYIRDKSYEELKDFRITAEESSLTVSPLQILRGFGALRVLSSGKCKRVLTNLISEALNGYVERNFDKEQDILQRLHQNYFGISPICAIKVFIEDATATKFDESVLRALENDLKDLRRESTEKTDAAEEEKADIVERICFRHNPKGDTLIAAINKSIKLATRGQIQYALKRDLAPSWKSRLLLVSVYDGTFDWYPPDSVIQETSYFYDTFSKKKEQRSMMKYYKCEGDFRTYVTDDKIRVLELESSKDDSKMFIFQPLEQEFSSKFLRKINGDAIRNYVEGLPRNKDHTRILVPHIIITSPVGLRSVFNRKSSLFGPRIPFSYAWRIFSPNKAEFSKIYRRQSVFGSAFVYPLWDHLHRTKFSLRLEHPKPMSITKKRDLPRTEEMTHKDALPQGFRITKAIGRLMIVRSANVSNAKKYIIGIIDDKAGNFPFDDKFWYHTTQSDAALSARAGASIKAGCSQKAGVVGKGIMKQNESRIQSAYIPQANELIKAKPPEGKKTSSKTKYTSKIVDIENEKERKSDLHSVDRATAGADKKDQDDVIVEASDQTSQKTDRLAEVDEDEIPAYDPRYTAKPDAKEVDADVIINTPFLYIVALSSKNCKLLVGNMGRFTNVAETRRS